MRHVDFDPTKLTGDKKVWWDNWLARAENATKDIIDTWETTGKVSSDDFNNSVWVDLKAWLLDNFFDNKCAYCETNVAEARQPGHAEHFRPKGGIKNKVKTNGEEKLQVATTTDADGQNIDHPGYF